MALFAASRARFTARLIGDLGAGDVEGERAGDARVARLFARSTDDEFFSRGDVVRDARRVARPRAGAGEGEETRGASRARRRARSRGITGVGVWRRRARWVRRWNSTVTRRRDIFYPTRAGRSVYRRWWRFRRERMGVTMNTNACASMRARWEG